MPTFMADAPPTLSPPPFTGLDHSFVVFREGWRRAAWAQLALAIASLASTAWLTSLFSLAGAATVVHFTRSDGGWAERMAASVSTRAWLTKGRVEPTGTLASLRIVSWLTLVAILIDLGGAIMATLLGYFRLYYYYSLDIPYLWLLCLSVASYPLLLIHFFVSFFSARAWLRDACDWLELLPRPVAPAAIEWELTRASSAPKYSEQLLKPEESGLRVNLN